MKNQIEKVSVKLFCLWLNFKSGKLGRLQAGEATTAK